MKLDIHNIIITSISRSLLSGSSPWYHMFSNLTGIYLIWCEVIVILIHYDDTHRFTCWIPIHTKEDCNMLLVRCCKRVVNLTIETSDHHTITRRWWLRPRWTHELCQRHSWFPLARWSWSLVWNYLSEGHALPIISIFRELWIVSISRIYYWTWIRIVRDHHEIFHIYSWIPCGQDLTTWNYSCFPVSGWYPNIKEWTNMCEWWLDGCRHRILF